MAGALKWFFIMKMAILLNFFIFNDFVLRRCEIIFRILST